MIDVAIIGGGFAGLSAATALSATGARVLVLEARPGLGGRATAFTDPETGERVDNGQHILMGCYDETLAFLRRIGAGDRVTWQAGLSIAIIDTRGHESTLRLPAVASPLHLLGGVMAWEALSWAERFSVLQIDPAIRKGAHPDETVREWLARNGQAPRLCELFWEPLALAALNQSIDRAAASSFVAILVRMFGPDPLAASIVLPAVPLDELYAEPSRAWLLDRGSEVRTNAPATIEIDGNRVRAVRVRGERIEVNQVISSVPWHGFGALFETPPPPLAGTIANAAALGSCPIVTVNLWFDRPVISGPLVGLPGRAFQWVFDKASIVGESASHLSLVSSGADEIVAMTNEQLVAMAMSELRQAVPSVRSAKVRKASAVRERRSTFSLAPGGPPRPQTATGIEGLWLAGDWTDTGLPATIESAVLSGHRAAGLILAGGSLGEGNK